MSSDELAGFVGLGGGALVLTTQRGLNPAVPAIAAPIAVAWPHGAPALGAGVVLGALTLARPRRLPGPALLFALALAILIAVTGDGGLVRGGAAAVAIAVATPAFVRTVEDLVLAGTAFGLASAGVALGAGVAGVGGVRADILAVAAAAGLAASAGAGARSIAAADLAGVLALPSKAGLIAAAVAIVGLLVVRRLPSIDAILAALATAIAWFAGAPFAHAHLRHVNAFTDTYHRLGATGVVLFVLLLGATVWGLPRPFAPGILAAAAGAIFVPLEATAPLWLLAGFAATSSSPEGPLRMALDEQRLLGREAELEAERQALAEEQRRLRRRRAALEQREAQLAGREFKPEPPPPPEPEPVVTQPEGWDVPKREEHWVTPEPIPESERDLEQQTRVLLELGEALAERERKVAERERKLERRAAPEAQAPPPPAAVVPAPQSSLPAAPSPPARPPEPEPAPARGELQPQLRHWTFSVLSELVEARAVEFPDRIDEWRIYLETLAPYAEDGILPPAFDSTVLDVFGPLLA